MCKKLLSMLILTTLVASILVGCSEECGSTLTILSISEGDVLVMEGGTDSWEEAQVGMALEPGDSIKTGSNSSAEITFFDGSTIELEAGAEIEIISLDISADCSSTTITLEQTIGTTISRVVKILDPASRYEVETPSGVVAVRGSSMLVQVFPDGSTLVTNLAGEIWVTAEGVELQIPEGQVCITRPGQPPQLMPFVYILTITSTTGGFVTTPGEGTLIYDEETVVDLVAEADEGYYFDNWTGDVGTIADVSAASTNITVSGNYSITAEFQYIPMVAAGVRYTVGLKSDGTVVAVGRNIEGQCDVGNWTYIVQVSAGCLHTVGLKTDGTLVAVGNNDKGQCNVGGWTGIVQVAAGDYHTVGVKSDGTVVAVGRNLEYQCQVGGWTGIVQVAAGTFHTVGVKSNGTVVAVGWNYYGQCDVSGWTGIVQVAAGYYHTVGLKPDGTVVAVGDNFYGQCNVGGWTGIVQVAVGTYHTVGLKSDGTLVTVGDNEYGQCDVGGWTGIVQVAAGWIHTVGLKPDGTVVAVGSNDSGQCDVGGWTLIV